MNLGESGRQWPDAKMAWIRDGMGAQWGAQGGLLSVREMSELYREVCRAKPRQILEVGHFHGLSTAVLHEAADDFGGAALLTVDHHRGDPWVPHSPEEPFLINRAFAFPRAVHLRIPSQDLTPAMVRCCDFVFYDGDHGDEQLRFVAMVNDLEEVKTLVLDDIDFDNGVAAVIFLRAQGWERFEPWYVQRTTGPDGKAWPETFTLGIFRRKP